MEKTYIKLRNDRLKTETELSYINKTLETVTFNMTLIKQVNPEFYEGIRKIYNQVPFFMIEKSKEENKTEEKNENEPNGEVDTTSK